ncbi:Ankyrin repeat-containing protein ITN1 [Bienertia sinuspersici]
MSAALLPSSAEEGDAESVAKSGEGDEESESVTSSEEEGDEELREAAIKGDVEFLRKCIAADNPNEYYLTNFRYRYVEDIWDGNIFHIAAQAKQEEFVREAIEKKLLPMEVVNQLLYQQFPDIDKEYPIHIAARNGNLKIVKMFLNAPNNNDNDDKPAQWLLKDNEGNTPCYTAVYEEHEECALEILKMDKEGLLLNMLNDDGESLLYRAVFEGLNKVAMEILTSPHSFSYSGPLGHHALHVLPFCPSEGGKDICRLFLKKVPKLMTQKDNDGDSVFHSWASSGKLWPFECVLESNDIIPDVRKHFIYLIYATNSEGMNPLHYLPEHKPKVNKEGVKIGKLLIDIYREESSSKTSKRELQYPWLVQDNEMNTPLDYAINKGNEEFANLILSEDKNALNTCQKDVLFKAIEKRCQQVTLKILEIVDEKGWTHLLTNDQRLNALHLAPKCSKEFCKELLKRHPELLQGIDKSGNTILHTWIKIGLVWAFEYLLNNEDIDYEWREHFISLIYNDDTNGDKPLHIAASSTYEATHQVVMLLVQALSENSNKDLQLFDSSLPWYSMNPRKEIPLHLAIRCQPDQRLALYLLSLSQGDVMNVLDICKPEEHKILFLAIQKNFFEVVKFVLTRLDKSSWTKYLKDSFTGQNVLHLASTCTDKLWKTYMHKNVKKADKDLGRWLVEEAPEFITQPDKSGITPLDVACEVGASQIIEAMLEKDPLSTYNKLPLAWVKACEKGHVSVIHAFIDCCPEKFSDHCIQHHDSPLHHIKLRNLMRYEEFLKLPYMNDLINLQDSNGATPLHKAIENRNILLAEALLNMDKIKYKIKDNESRTARIMLAKLSKEQDKQWDQMCKNIGFDANLNTSYFQRKTDLLEVRNTLSVVAALLATITFTAGFTLPGGLNQDTGEATLATKAAFLAFLISDTIAMCFSMLVLLCLIWSMVFEPNQSLFLIDRSVGLLRVALYCTLLAFMTGVYIVIAPKTLWAAILIIVMCCFVGISANKTLLYKVLSLVDNLMSFADKKSKDSIHLMEMVCSSFDV